MGQLKTYSISKKADKSFDLNFETEVNTEVSFNFDATTKVNSITLKSGKPSPITSFSKNYTSDKGVLKIKFIQNDGTKLLGPGDPDIDITDTDF